MSTDEKLTPQPADLPSDWRARAIALERWGAPDWLITVWMKAADELEAALRAGHDALLSREEAARIEGVHPDTITRRIREVPFSG